MITKKTVVFQENPLFIDDLKNVREELGELGIFNLSNYEKELDKANDWQPNLILFNSQTLQNLDYIKKIPQKNNLKIIPIFLFVPYDKAKQTDFLSPFLPYVEEIIFTPIRKSEFLYKLANLYKLSSMQQEILENKAENKQSKDLLNKYFSKEIIDQISNSEDDIMEGKHLEATILFFDIRGSTQVSESLEPKIFAQFLNDILTDIIDLIYGSNGSVNKLLGDGIMATFGCPVPLKDSVLKAAECAIQILDYFKMYNDVRPDYIKRPVKAGVGIATGKVFAGNIGSVRRMEYTIIGDVVNIAAKLEALTKKFNKPILTDERTRLDIGHRGRFESLEATILGDRFKEVKPYYLLDLV